MIAIFAGNGELPKEIIKSLIIQKKSYIIINLSNNNYQNSHRVNLGRFGEIIKILKKNKIKEAIFAGKIYRPNFASLSFDMTSLRFIPKLKGAFKKGDGGLLDFASKVLKSYNINVVASHKYCKNLLLENLATKQKPSNIDLEDLKKSCSILKSLSKFDNAQAIIVDNGHILSIEAAEGTDLMLKRTSYLKKKFGNKKSGVLVKMPKKGQSLNYDLPTIGIKTIKLCINANLKGIFLKKNKNIFLNKEKAIILANKNNFFISAI
jgi:DUF1009 family protein